MEAGGRRPEERDSEALWCLAWLGVGVWRGSRGRALSWGGGECRPQGKPPVAALWRKDVAALGRGWWPWLVWAGGRTP